MGQQTTKNTLIAIGEALIDFMPEQSGRSMKEVESFKPAVGGAPANVCAAFKKLGGNSRMLTQLGNDPFGDKIIDEFLRNGIDSSYIARTDRANTSLAFVALKEDGNREFSFYRKPGADMLFSEDLLKKECFEDGYCLHFCSVSLGDFPMKKAHQKAIEYGKNNGMLISFDPNLRPALWADHTAMISAVKEFMPQADILKISDEELESMTAIKDKDEAIRSLFTGNIKLVLYTKGSQGAEAFTKKTKAQADGIKVKALDTTGAGDGFIGAFLYKLYQDGIKREDIEYLSADKLTEYMRFANRFCSISVQKKGAIASYPGYEEVEKQDDKWP